MVATGVRHSDKRRSVYASVGPDRASRNPDFSLRIDESRALTGMRAAGNVGTTTLRLTGTSCAAPLTGRLIAEGAITSIGPRSMGDPVIGKGVLDAP